MRYASWAIGLVLPVWLLLGCSPADETADPENGEARAGERSQTGSWPMFRGGPQQTGVAESTLSESLELLWTFEAGADIESTAAIEAGVVFVGALDGALYALDLESGEMLWKYQAEEEIRSSPSVYEGTVYFGDELGFFHAVDAETGEKRWTFESYAGIVSGSTFWQDRVLFGSYDNSLYCLERDTGKLVWQVETDGYVHGTPAIAGGLTTVSGCDGFLWLIEIDDGSVVTKIDLQGQSPASPAIVGDMAYVGTFENEVLGVNIATYEVEWRYEHPKRKFPYYASAAATPDIVVVGGRDKIVHALDAATGKARWTYPAGARIDSSAVIVGNRVFIATTRGEVLALDLATGEPTWQYETGSAFTASPSVAQGRLVISSLDGVVYCFG